MSYDSLALTSIKNNLTSTENLADLKSSILLSRYSALSDAQAKEILDKVMTNTTIKRACCLNSGNGPYPVRVRIPIPYPETSDEYKNLPDFNKKFGFIDKIIYVPASLCQNLDSPDGKVTYKKPDRLDSVYNRQCDDFYKLYCDNMLNFFIDENKQVYPATSPDPDVFAKDYKPECACYNLNTDFPKGVPISAKCLMYTGCSEERNDNGLVYLDPDSRKKCEGNYNICSQVIELGGLSAGGNINISPALRNQCSTVWSNATGGATTSGSPTSGTTTSGTTYSTSGTTTSGTITNNTTGTTTSGTTYNNTTDVNATGNTTSGTNYNNTSGTTITGTAGNNVSGTTTSGTVVTGTPTSSSEETVVKTSDNFFTSKVGGSELPVWGLLLIIIIVLLLLCSSSYFLFGKKSVPKTE